MLDRIKTLLGITDTLQDEVIEILMSNVSNHLQAMLGKDIPEVLEFIVVEVTIRRFNRLGTEGAKSESVEGHSVTYYELTDEFVPYHSLIEANKEDEGYNQRGRVYFI